MRGHCILGAVIAGLMATTQPASAGPISSYGASFFLGFDVPSVTTMVDLPDLNKGGTVSLPGGAYYRPGSSPADPSAARPIVGSFLFELGIKTPDGAGLESPRLEVHGVRKGQLTGPSGEPPRFGGGFDGTVTSIDAFTSPRNPIVPEPLLALLNDPGRIHIKGVVVSSPGVRNEGVMQQTLTIDPAPVAAPEPSTLALLIVAAGGALARRRG